eukprot:UN25141
MFQRTKPERSRESSEDEGEQTIPMGIPCSNVNVRRKKSRKMKNEITPDNTNHKKRSYDYQRNPVFIDKSQGSSLIQQHTPINTTAEKNISKSFQSLIPVNSASHVISESVQSSREKKRQRKLDKKQRDQALNSYGMGIPATITKKKNKDLTSRPDSHLHPACITGTTIVPGEWTNVEALEEEEVVSSSSDDDIDMDAVEKKRKSGK